MSGTDEDPVHRAIRELSSAQTKHLNRLLACEALLHSLLARIDPLALAGLAEEYDQALDRLAAQLPPSLQMPAVWQDFADAIEDRRKATQPRQLSKPNDAG